MEAQSAIENTPQVKVFILFLNECEINLLAELI